MRREKKMGKGKEQSQELAAWSRERGARGSGRNMKGREMGARGKEKSVETEKEDHSYLYGLAARLALALLLSLGSLAIFYAVFSPITIYPSYWLISQFYPIDKIGNYFYYGDYIIAIIDACVAGAAYYLLAALNLTTKGLAIWTRVKAFAFGALALLALNVFRIVLLTLVLFSQGKNSFNQIHISFWIIGSTLFVAGIWILTTKIFRIKEVPVYSDLMEVLRIYKKAHESPRQRRR